MPTLDSLHNALLGKTHCKSLSVRRPLTRGSSPALAMMAILVMLAMFLVGVASPRLAAAAGGHDLFAAGEAGNGSDGAADSNARTTDGSSTPNLESFLKVVELIQKYYADEPDMEQVYQGAMRGAVRSLGDPYSVYLDPEQLKDFTEGAIEGEFSGIGVAIDMVDGFVTVITPLPGTPAYYADVKPGDRIVGVDGVDVRNKITSDVADMIRGEPGTKVSLTILRDGKEITFDLTRVIIHPETVSKRMFDGTQLGYIKITQFTKGTAEAFGEALDVLKFLGAKGIVLDLRDNPGGLLDEALWIANKVVPAGPIMTIIKKDGKKLTLQSTLEEKPLPMAVLVNGGSASASEVLAGAIKDRGTGFLVGTKTFGKGSVQTVLKMDNGGALKITTARYLTPAGEEVNLKGLNPDVEVKPDTDKASVPATVHLTRSIQQGTVGLDALALQEALNYLGFNPGPFDGVFGEKTARAVRDFQIANGLSQTSIPDEATVSALNEALLKTRREAPAMDIQTKAAVEELMRRLEEPSRG